MAKFDIPTFEIPTEATRPLYAGCRRHRPRRRLRPRRRRRPAEAARRRPEGRADPHHGLDFEPKALRDQAIVVVTTQIDALSKDAKARREAIEARVAELQAEAAGIPATVTATYADLAKRGEVLVGRIRTQESTKATATAAKTTTAKAKTTKTQATKAAKKTTTTAKKSTKSTAKKATSTAKKTSTAPKSSAKATTTAAKKTASSRCRRDDRRRREGRRLNETEPAGRRPLRVAALIAFGVRASPALDAVSP